MAGKTCLPVASRRLLLLDTAVAAIISGLILAAAHLLTLMSIAVPAILLMRLGLAVQICRKEGRSLAGEVLFYLICTLLGAFNDWNSVVHHAIYEYQVPYCFTFSTIPVWMLLYWGLVLRLMAGAGWMVAGSSPPDKLGIGRHFIRSVGVRLIFLIILGLLTRRFIYIHYLHPVMSWMPFLVAFLLALVTTYPGRRDFYFLGICLVAGPLVEIAYINLGQLHVYYLGVVAGLPVWLILWWLLSAMIWREASLFLFMLMHGRWPRTDKT